MQLKNTIRIAMLAVSFNAAVALMPAQESPKEGDRSLPQSPFGEKRGKVSMFGEAIGGHWTLSGGVHTSAMYVSSTGPAGAIGPDSGDIVQQFGARLTASIFSKRIRYEVHYLPEYSRYHELSSQNAFRHSFAQDLAWRVNSRWDLKWSLDGRKFKNNQLLGSSYAGVPGFVLGAANLQSADQNQELVNGNTSVAVTYNKSAADKFTFGVSSGVTHFLGATTGISQADIQYSFSGSAGWNRTFASGLRSVGLEVSHSYFGFVGPNRHQQFQAAKVRYSQKLPWQLNASIGAGPSFSQGQPRFVGGPREEEISWALDASIDRAIGVWNVGVSYNHGEQLSLIQQTTTSDQLGVRVQRTFGRLKRWSVATSAGFTRSNRADLSGYQDGLTGSFNLGYRISRHLSFNAAYAYAHQHDQFSINPAGKVNRHQATAGFSYSFGPFQPSFGR